MINIPTNTLKMEILHQRGDRLKPAFMRFMFEFKEIIPRYSKGIGKILYSR